MRLPFVASNRLANLRHRARERRFVAGALLVVGATMLCLFTLLLCPVPTSQSFRASGRPLILPSVSLPQGTVSVNFGDAEELMSLPGVGETLAGLIIDEREENGLFFLPEDLLAVKGIGETKLSRMWDLLDMNTD